MQIAILVFMIFNFIVNIGLSWVIFTAVNAKIKEYKKLKENNPKIIKFKTR